MLIHTTKGLIERDLLEIKDVFTEEDNARIHATEWFLDGELVRRDCNVSILRGLEVSDAQSSFQ